MAVDPKGLSGFDTNDRGNISAAEVKIIACDPAKKTAIALNKNSHNAKVEVTTDARLSNGTSRITDLEEANILWNEVSASNTTNYFAGDSSLLTGVRLTDINGPAKQYSVTQKDVG